MASFNLDSLNAAITRLDNVDDGVRALITALNAQVGDPAALAAAVTRLNANIDDTVAAIVAGTPVEDAPPEE